MLFGITGLGSAAVAVALPTLADDLEVSTGRAALVVSCYSLALAVGSAVCGRLGDLLGIRLPLLVGLAIMVTAASAGALVDSLPALVVTRTLQGLGASAAPALTLAAVQALFAGDARARALATYAGIGGTVNALGPVIGSALVDPFGWRPVVAIPVATLALAPFVWRVLPSDRQAGATLDPVGTLLVALAALGAVLSLQAATLGPPVALVGLALLVLATPTAVLRSCRVPTGIVPAALLRSDAAVRSLLTAASLSSAWFGMLVAVPTSFAGRGWTGVQVGLLLVPAAVLGVVAPRITGPLLIRLGAVRSQLVATTGVTAAVLLAALGTFINARLVMRLGMRRIARGAYAMQIIVSGLFMLALWTDVLPPALRFPAFFLWAVSLFMMAGLTFGNLNALAMQRKGHIAGMTASVVSPNMSTHRGMGWMPTTWNEDCDPSGVW